MTLRVSASRLDQRITFQSRSAGSNSLGEAPHSFVDAFTVWAQAEPLRGREFFSAAQMQQTSDVRFRALWRGDITPSMRVMWNGVPHDITAVIDVDGGRHTLEIMATTGVRDGR